MTPCGAAQKMVALGFVAFVGCMDAGQTALIDTYFWTLRCRWCNAKSVGQTQ